MVFRNSFDALSLALDDEEDNIEALMTFSLSQTTAPPLHVSVAQDIPFQAQVICNTYQETIYHHWNEIQTFLHGETAISHGQHKWHGVQFLLEKL